MTHYITFSPHKFSVHCSCACDKCNTCEECRGKQRDHLWTCKPCGVAGTWGAGDREHREVIEKIA